MSLRHHVGDLVHGTSHEIHELKLSHRPHSSKRSAKPVNESIGDLERTTINTNVLTKTEDGRIAFHLLPNPLPDSLKVCKLRHEFSISKNSVIPSEVEGPCVLFQVHCSFRFFEPASPSFDFRNPILRLNRMAPIFTINPTQSRLRLRHRRAHRRFTLNLNLFLNLSNQLFILGRSQPLLRIHQIILKPSNRITLLPILKNRLRDIIRAIVNGMPD